MEKLNIQPSAAGYSVATAGDLASFRGKAFVKDVLGTTSVEVSIGSLEPGESVPFFHHHRQNEEVYLIVSGRGTLLLDGHEVGVASGSIVRVEPAVSRQLRCEGSETLVYLCIQGKEGSLEQYTMTDGVIEP